MLPRLLVSLMWLLALVTVLPLPADAAVPTSRVRAIQPRLQRALENGIVRSPTLRQLVLRVEESDIIVYLDLVSTMPPGLTAGLSFLNAADGFRYLYVAIGGQNVEQRIIQLLGHELQHVVEVAQEPGVRSAETLRTLYRRIGMPARNGKEFDSTAAWRAEVNVRQDLARVIPAAESATRMP